MIYRLTSQVFVWAGGAGAASHPAVPATCDTLTAKAGSKGKATAGEFWGQKAREVHAVDF